MKVKLNEITSQEKYIKEQNRTKWNQRDFITICQSDPTYDAQTDKVGKYTNWLLATIQSINDLNTVRIPLEWYADGVKRGILRRYNIPSDINAFKTVDELVTTMRSIMQNTDSQMSNSESNNRKKLEGQFKVISSNEDYEIIQTFTFKAERYFGSGTEWCTVANKDYFDEYDGTYGELFIFYPRNGKKEMKMQFHVDSDSYATYDDNVSDNALNCIMSCAEINQLDEVFIKRTCELSNSTRLFEEAHYRPIEEAITLLKNGYKPSDIFEFYDSHEGFARVRLNNKYNFLIQDGNFLSNQWFDWVGIFKNGFARVELNNKYNFLKQDGHILYDKPPKEWFILANEFSEGFAGVRLNGKENFLTQDGNFLYDKPHEEWFDDVRYFHKGFAAVSLQDRDYFLENGLQYCKITNKYNFLTKDGKILSNQWFDNVGDFKEDFAKVKIGKEWYYIDKNGQLYNYETKEPIIMEQRNRLKQIVQEEITKSDEKRIKEIVADSVSELFKALWQKNNFWKSDIKK